MNGIFLWSAVAIGLAVGVAGWVMHLAKKRHEHLRGQGYALISALKAYAAWVDCRRDEPFMAGELDELALPEPLARACAIKEAAFRGLSQDMVRLLQAHSRLVEYLWHQNLLRLSQEAGWRPVWQDPQYRQIRGAQEELIQELIGRCQEKIGDR